MAFGQRDYLSSSPEFEPNIAAVKNSVALVAAEPEKLEGALGPLPHRNRKHQVRGAEEARPHHHRAAHL